MNEEATVDILLTGFNEADLPCMIEAAQALGRSAITGDPTLTTGPCLVLAAAYDETGLRGHRAAAIEDARPWCFCVPALDRGLIAAAALSREGLMLLLPPQSRELKRLLVALGEEAKERNGGDAAFSGLETLEAAFSWKSSAIDISRVCRRLARLLGESGFYRDRSAEDECSLALEEALVNSVEHGNLELSSTLRPDSPLDEDLYEVEREKRAADPAYGDRLVRVRLCIHGPEARIVLEDEGRGFDTSKLSETPSGLEVSGKGFWLIKRPFDAALYNEKGNSLTLSKLRPPAMPTGGFGAR